MQLSNTQLEVLTTVIGAIADGKLVQLGSDDESMRVVLKSVMDKLEADQVYEAYRLAILRDAQTEEERAFIKLGRRLPEGTVYTSGANGKITKMWMAHVHADPASWLPKRDKSLTAKEREILGDLAHLWKWEAVGVNFLNGEAIGFTPIGKVYFPTRDFVLPKKNQS